MSMSQVSSLTRIAVSTGRPLVAAFLGVALAGALAVIPAQSEDATATAAAATYKDIEQSLGKVPAFLKPFPAAGVTGAWGETKGLLFSGDTALTAKEKSLISLAVAAQIPCSYCIWSDTNDARRAGATEDEIAEAVAVASLTRHWSTWLNGMQIDFDAFKADLGGDVAPAMAGK
jgi:AhpD family alkylhydroperoxidase